MEATAIRTWNKPHTKATVTVTVDGVALKPVGGARAAQCRFALLYIPNNGRNEWQLLGLRAASVSEYGATVVPIVEAEDVETTYGDVTARRSVLDGSTEGF